MDDKKARERKLLDAVFSADLYKVAESETPDFVLTGNNVTIGIEVTELYRDESSARLARRPDYLKSLLEEERHWNKIDKKKLPVSDLTFRDAEGNVRSEMRGILRHYPSPAEFESRFVEAVEKKSGRCRTYRDNWNETGLVILDGDNYFSQFTVSQFNQVFLSIAVRKKLSESPFGEVYLITKFLESETGHSVVYLKLTSVLMELFLAASIVPKHYQLGPNKMAEMQIHLKSLHSLGYDVEAFYSKDDIYYLVAGLNAMAISGKHIEVKMVNTLLNFDGETLLQPLDSDLTDEYVLELSESRRTTTIDATVSEPSKVDLFSI